jgi:chromosome segregation ATPase
MGTDLADRVSILEQTVSAEIGARVAMRQDIGKVEDLLEKRSRAQLRLLQAIADTQSEHSTALRDVRAKVDRMAPQVHAIETKVDGVHFRMGILENRMGGLDSRIGHVEDKIEQVDTRIGHVEDKIEQVDTRIGHVEDKVGQLDTKIDTVAEELNGKFDTVIDLLRNGK